MKLLPVSFGPRRETWTQRAEQTVLNLAVFRLTVAKSRAARSAQRQIEATMDGVPGHNGEGRPVNRADRPDGLRAGPAASPRGVCRSPVLEPPQAD